MIIKRAEVLKEICKKIGISKRAKPSNSTFTKFELMQLCAHLDIIGRKLQDADSGEGGTKGLSKT